MGLAAPALILAAIMAPFGDGAEREIPKVDGVRSALARSALTGQITVEDRRAWQADYDRARTVVRRLDGAREGELRVVLTTLQDQAAAGQLTPSRMPLAFGTLRRNTTQWSRRPFPVPGARMTFGRDPAVFQYFVGQGVQFHPLATAGRAAALAPPCQQAADARAAAEAEQARRAAEAAAQRQLAHRVSASSLYEGETRHSARPARPARHFGCRRVELTALLDTLMTMSSRRDGFVAWEYDFSFAGSAPLWISAMTQATAAQALARGAQALGVPEYGDAAVGALAAFTTPPPLGVALPRAEYAMYSFNPGLHVLNGYLQAIIGLHDIAEDTGSADARRLFTAGERTARGWVPEFDTGAWSRYSLGGAESTLSYHRLVTGFLGGLCDRTQRAVYCDAHARFTRYLHEPPRIHLLQPAKGKEDLPTALTFSLSKVSDVVVRVTRRETILRTAMHLPRGAGYRIPWTPPRAGTYTVKVAAVGPEGLRGVARTTVEVKKKKEIRRRAERPTKPGPCRRRCRPKT